MGSYTRSLYHAFFSTKNRKNTLPQDYLNSIYNYIWGIIKNKKCKLFRIGGTSDHIHILFELNPKVALAELIKDIKVSSSIFIKKEYSLFNGWQSGYSSLTYSYDKKDILIKYIKNQKEHHRTNSFEDELKTLIEEFESKNN
ncbi:MAG TPA: IS200/IS605 family transposase [Ignavibacteriaceae bacterium]|nr:IS200/IS605 family transposase [Ignavibacteriaceae bacterium]